LTAAAAAENRENPPSPSQMRPSVVSLGRPPSVRSPATVLLLLAASLFPNAVLSVESSTDSKREYFRIYRLPMTTVNDEKFVNLLLQVYAPTAALVKFQVKL